VHTDPAAAHTMAFGLSFGEIESMAERAHQLREFQRLHGELLGLRLTSTIMLTSKSAGAAIKFGVMGSCSQSEPINHQ
jgi:hypothetical protein